MTTDRHYVGKINPDDTRTLWRIDDQGGTRLDVFAWAGDGEPGWGSEHDPDMADREIDCALAILADHYDEPGRAFEDAELLARTALAHSQPDTDLVVHETVLHSIADVPHQFRADATPVRDLIAATIADTGDRLAVVAEGLGFDLDWAATIASGDITHLDLDEVKQICQWLYVTPYDLWQPREAKVIEGLWPARDWPAAQPIDLTAPIGHVPPDTTWHVAVEPAATAPLEVAVR